MEGCSGLRPRARCASHELVDHLAHDLVGRVPRPWNLVGGAEAVEEVEEGHAGPSVAAWAMRAKSIASWTLLEAEQGPAGRAAGHDVRVVAEDREGLGRDGAGGDVEHGRGQLAGDLEHVGDHEEQALDGGEGRGECPAGQCSVHRAGSARLGLELDDGGDVPQMFLRPWAENSSDSSPMAEEGRDRVDRDHFAGRAWATWAAAAFPSIMTIFFVSGIGYPCEWIEGWGSGPYGPHNNRVYRIFIQYTPLFPMPALGYTRLANRS